MAELNANARSRTCIFTLHPSVRSSASSTLCAINEELDRRSARYRVIVTQCMRTMEQQALLYAKGRTIPGVKVTNAKPGQSMHNYGFAIDIALIDVKVNKGEVIWDAGRLEWQLAVKYFKNSGWEWGGDWYKFKDYPHFEKPPMPLKELQVLYAKQDNKGYINIVDA